MTHFVYSRSIINQFCEHSVRNTLNVTNKFAIVLDPKLAGFTSANLIILLSISSENGLLSYENPNYHLDPKSIKHNQNLFEEIMSESKQRGGSETKVIMSNRKSYACLDIGSMGVDLKENFE